MNASELIITLGSYHYHFATEAELQESIALALQEEGILHEREKALGESGRVDFFIPDGKIALEVKISGPAMQVARQLLEYARCDMVTSLLLVTSRMQHRQVPRELNGKPVSVLTTKEAGL